MRAKNTSVLERLVQVGPDFITTFTKPGPHCVMATTIGQMVLARKGIVAHPYPVEVVICNQAWVDWSEDKYRGGAEEQIRRGAYILSNTPHFNGRTFRSVVSDNPWDGHLVLRVPDGEKAWLLDLDMGSFNRPQHGICLPGGVLAPLTDGCVHGTFTDHRNCPTSVEYGPLDAPYKDDYQTARDWVERDRLVCHVDELLEML